MHIDTWVTDERIFCLGKRGNRVVVQCFQCSSNLRRHPGNSRSVEGWG